MKYTVVIQRPVQEELRPELERQLSRQLGLGVSAAGRLASRRSGRLLKPTTRPKAEKLLAVFGEVGAAVSLEEVPEEGEMGLGALTVSVPDERQATPQQESGTSADPFGTGSFSTESFSTEPFSADPFSTEPFGADPFGTGLFGAGAPEGGSAAVPEGRTQTQTFRAAPGGVETGMGTGRSTPRGEPRGTDDEWASFTQGLGGQAVITGSSDSDDAWADFADSLKIDVPAPTSTQVAPAPLTPDFMDMVDDTVVPVAEGPRRSLEWQLPVISLLPAAALSLLSLLLLALFFPAARQNLAAEQTQTLARTLSTTLPADNAQALQNRLRTLVADDGIAFVQVNIPGGPTYFASDMSEQESQAMQQDFAQWQQGGGRGVFRSGASYITAQSGDTAEAAVPAPQVTVGTPYRSNLSGVVLPWLLMSLLLLGLTALWTRRATQAILSPIQRLVRAADAISAGDLSQPVQAEANDEVGDLAQALERMRLSLSAAMERLRKRKR